jgi:hypothetical protein
VQVPQPIRTITQQKLAPIFLNNHETMYADGFRNSRATLLRLPTVATNMAMIFVTLTHAK